MLASTLTNVSNAFLSEGQKQSYLEKGFLVLENFIPPSICELLIERSHYLITKMGDEELRTIFSSRGAQHEQNNYFLNSGDKICCFFEEAAFDENHQLTKNKLLAINKIGHALHDLDPIFNCFSRSFAFANLAASLNIKNPLLYQSMIICKQAFIGGEVQPHQDSTYLYLENEPVTGFWLALEDAHLENGCLWVLPGGHKSALKSRFKRNGDRTFTETYDTTPWDLAKMQALEVKAGSLIVLHGLLPHMSKTNFSAKSRYAFTLHLGDTDNPYAADNWLQRPNDFPFRSFMF